MVRRVWTCLDGSQVEYWTMYQQPEPLPAAYFIAPDGSVLRRSDDFDWDEWRRTVRSWTEEANGGWGQTG